VQCEHCGRKFAAEPKQRAVEFQEHRSNQQGCGPTPPDIYEGMTELQWAKINALPRQSRSTSANDKPRLSVRKWNQVWDVLFPREKPPPPCEFCSSKDASRSSKRFQGVNEMKIKSRKCLCLSKQKKKNSECATIAP
jgi:hypothetical protein